MVVQGRIDGKPLADFELLSYYFLLVVAGNETTRNAMTGGIQCFIDNPGEWQKLAKDPGLVEGAIEETVRWTTPVIQFSPHRHARHGACATRRSARASRCASSTRRATATRRSSRIPSAFRIDRKPNDHVGFGRGEHVCLGAHLARLEIRTMYHQLRERLVSMERTGARRPGALQLRRRHQARADALDPSLSGIRAAQASAPRNHAMVRSRLSASE